MKTSNKEEEEPHFVKRDKFAITAEYKQWFADIKSRLRNSQIKAAIKVNSTLLEFYWSLGCDIVKMKAEQAWGSGVLQQLSFDLRDEFPGMKGLSYTNLRYAAQWFRFYTSDDESICQQLVGELSMPQKFALVPWGHHIEIMAKSKTVDEALFYINEVIAGNWSRATLMNMQKASLYEKRGKAQTNFNDKLPQPQDELAQEILKDPYNFDFLTLDGEYRERELEQALTHNVTRFLLELGTGFAFVGSQVSLQVGEDTVYPDLLFYHLELRCYVVVELKVTKFKGEHLGQLGVYVSAVNHIKKKPTDNPTIGLLICKTKNNVMAQYALESTNQPIGISEYQLSKLMPEHIQSQLPTIEDIEATLSDNDDNADS